MNYSNEKCKQLWKEKDGFTLIEMIITIAIISILTSLAAWGIHGWLSASYTARVSETAKTVFYAAQNYMLEKKQMGQLEEFHQSANAYGGDLSWDLLKQILAENNEGFDSAAYEEKYETETTSFILMSKGSGEANPLYQIVKEATNDDGLLENTFLLEYDHTTGVVRSVFYSEQTDDFSYFGAYDQRSNVILRNTEALHEKKQGYYGVDITGAKGVSEIFLEEPQDVALVNGERLYLQWNDINDENPEFDLEPSYLEELIYDITVSRKTETGVELLFTVEGARATNINGTNTLDEVDDLTTNYTGYRLAYNHTERTYQLLIDDIHHSLFTTYKLGVSTGTNVTVNADVTAEDTLICEVITRLDPDTTGIIAESFPGISNEQSSAYGGGDQELLLMDGGKLPLYGSGEKETGESKFPFSINKGRHLENLRYAVNTKEKSNFIQTDHIDFSKIEERPYSEDFLTILYTSPFRGSLKAEKDETNQYYSISNMKIKNLTTQPTGIFSQNMGEIAGLTLDHIQVRGNVCVGVLAGANGGNLENITVTKSTVKGSHVLGGVTGYNTQSGEMSKVSSVAEVESDTKLLKKITIEGVGDFPVESYGHYVGGIAGLNRGEAEQLTSGVLTGNVMSGSVTGTKYVGGVFGSSESEEEVTLSELTNYQKIQLVPGLSNEDEAQCIGGILGFQGKGTLKGGANYGLLLLSTTNQAVKADQIVHIGGVVGLNQGAVENVMNYAGLHKDEKGSIDVKTLETNCINSVKKGSLPQYLGKYVGGIAGTNEDTGEIINCGNESGAVLGYSVVGGLVGNNLGKVRSNQATREVGGLIIASDYLAGGVFGYNHGEKVEKYQNKANIFGKGMVGGIMGFHGKIGTGETEGIDQILTYLKAMGTKDTPQYYSKLLNIDEAMNVGAAQGIDDCINQGFVYGQDFYVGGISGLNYGDVTESNSKKIENNKFSGIYDKGGADCVGGIVGFNGKNSTLNGQKIQKQTVSVDIIGDDFVGGIVGINRGKVYGYYAVEGGIYGQGDCVGGVLGLNSDASALSEVTNNKTSKITGEYFVGGIIGCNVAMTGSTNSEITGVHSESGTIKGIAYVGGILGYNAYVDPNASLDGLFGDAGELRVLKANAFSPDRTSSQTPGTQMTVFKECTNSAIISGDRYVGGIIGYNSERAPLWIAKCTNKGTVSILNPEKTPSDSKGEKFYYIGGITGRNSAAGVIHGCANDGKVLSPSTYLGGICEVNEGYIQFCSTGNQSAEITGETNSVGGIVGLNENKAFIVSCVADQYAKIKGGNRTGGLVGTNAAGGVVTSNFLGTEAKDVTAIGESALSSGKDAMSFSDATVIGKDHTGGIVGHNSGSVEYIEVRNNAKVTGSTNVGGFVGMNAKDASLGNKGSVISNLVNNAYVYGSNEVGGIVGRHDGTGITNCTNAGLVEASGTGQGTAGGITGTVTKGMYIEECTNYGLVKSNNSFAGGITGTNNGNLKNCNNYGSVEGSKMAISVSFEGEKANGSAIGGITGANFSQGNIIDCASRTRKDDPLGKENNPFWNDAEENKIKGNYIVGGIIGHYARHQFAGGDFMNTSPFSKDVSITIETLPVKIESTIRCYIGGVIGEYTPNPREEILENFIFSGTINASGIGGNNQQNIGGIVALQPEKVILKNCLFSGNIIGNGNNGDDVGDTGDYSGIGGLAGRANGKIILVPDTNGVCYSNTPDSKVEGARRVGGVVGETQSQFQLLVDTGGTDPVKLEDVNKDKKTSDQFIYYENYATVAGGKAVGGFFGSMNSRAQTTLRYLKNKGQILTLNINGKTDVGGLIGQAWQENTLSIIEDCHNYALIGTPEDLIVSNNVGGLIGSWTGTTKKTLANSSNEADATIYAGASNIGGLAGRMNSGEIRSSCVNKANMSINTAKANVTVNGVGGIVGYAQDLTIAPASITKLNGVDTEIKIIGMATAIGGTVGISNNTVNIKNIENTRTITATDSVNNNKDLRAGGIVGRRNGGTLTISECNNSAKLWMPGANCVGGIVGNSTGGGTLNVSNTYNNAEIQGNGFVGGLFGDLAGGTNKITEISNHASIKGTTYVAGISGRILNSTTTMTKAMNEEPIEGIVNSFGGSNVKFVGGCFGLVHNGTANLSQITNQGTVNSVKSETNPISSAREVGGIAGSLQGNKVQLNNSSNQGKVTVIATPSGNTVEVGGLVGSMRLESSIGALDTETIRSTNEAEVQVEGVSKVGGIVGFLDTKALVFHAINKGNVTGTNSNEVGGVVGDAYGLVYSCQTSKDVKVSGNASVGGLVGRAYNYTCKITSGAKGPVSSANPGYDLSVTHADVEGTERVGGLVGHQQEATIYNLYVSNEVEVTLLSKDPDKKYAAGGIVGYAGSVNTTKGILANCFSGATVKTASGDTTVPYIGGIIGYRERRNNEAVTSIVDCYMTAPRQIDNTLPSSEKGGTVVASPWAVGNEPLETLADGSTYIYSSSQDIQAHTASALDDPLLTAKKFEWCEDSYKALCAALGVPIGDWTKPEAISGIMGKYDGVKLLAPEMNPVRSGKVFDYTFPVRPIAGFYTEYGIKIYDGTYPLGTAMGSTDTPIFEVNEKIKIGDKIQDITIKFEEKFSPADLAQLVGKTLSVATYVKGYKLEDVGGYTKDSDIVVRQQFVIMPPLPQPKVVAVEPGPLDMDWFDPVTGKQTKIELEITNWSEYEAIAKEVYGELKNHSDKWAEANLFDQFINGVISFKMNDSYNVKKGEGIGTTQEIHTIKPKATATSGEPYFEVDPITNKAYIVIDYKDSETFKANSDTRPWHAFNITAVQGHAITINPLDATFKYHYLDSKSYTGVDYRLKNQLKIPDNLEGIFTGGSDIVADPLSPRYSLRWNLGGNVESDVAGWEVHLQKLIVKDPTGTGTPAEVSYDLKGADGINPYIITVNGAKTTKLDLSKQTLQDIFDQCAIDTSTSPWWSHKEKYILCFSVKTLSKDPNQYMHSVVSPTKEVELVKQEKSITDVAVTADNTNRMKITWTDPAFDSSQLINNGYIIDYKIELLGQLIQSGTNKISQVCEWKEIILDPKLADTSYTVTISITRVGIPGRSLNSDIYTAERIIGTKLQKPDNVKTEGIKTITNLDGTKSLLLNISWDSLEMPLQGEVDITNDNCKGYQVEVNTKENGTPYIETVNGWDTKSKQILVPMDGITKVEVSLKALSANSKTTDSDWVKNTHLTIGPILSTPKITSVKLNGTTFMTVPTDPIPPDAVAPIPAYMRKDYMKLSLGYDVVATGSIGQEITVLQVGQPNPLVVQNTTTTAGVAEVEILLPAEINLLSLAGKQLNIEMSNMSGNITAQLPSEVGTWDCTMPRIHLVRPEEPILSYKTITDSVLGGTKYTMYTVAGTVYNRDYLADEVTSGITEVEIKEEEDLVRVGQTYQLLHKTTVDGKDTYEPVEFVVLGDDGKPLKDTDGNMIKVKEYTVDNATENYEFYFTPVVSIDPAKASEYEISVVNKAKEDPANIRFADSKETKIAFQVPTASGNSSKTVSQNLGR